MKILRINLTVYILTILQYGTQLGSTQNTQQTYYGNDIIERNGPVMSNQTRGQRCWIYDWLKSSQLGWGYLDSYSLYISHDVPMPGPPLRLQIFTNTTRINQYQLKWEKRFTDYTAGQKYTVAVDGDPVEITEKDRIGFTTEGLIPAISYNFEEDDPETMSTAHRMYWTFLEWWNKPFPKKGENISMDNNAVRGVFSIGVTLSSVPRLPDGQQYVGYELKPRTGTDGAVGVTPGQDLKGYLDTKPLTEGRLVSFMFRLDVITTPIDLYLLIVQPTADYKQASVVYVKKVSYTASPSKTYTEEVGDSGPMINSSLRMGWIFVGQNPLFRSFSTSSEKVYISVLTNSQLPVQLNSAIQIDPLSFPYVYSIGVVINTKAKPTSTTVGIEGSSTKSSEDSGSSPNTHGHAAALYPHLSLIILCLLDRLITHAIL